MLLGPFHEGGWRRGRDGVEPIVDGREVAVAVVLSFRHVFLGDAGGDVRLCLQERGGCSCLVE